MFFFNDYRLTGEANFLENAHFKNFVIDGENATGKKYNSSGKGFMINLFKNCSWDNIVVKNTDGTGFGIDCPINSSITNCTAINCGKGATKDGTGASGFGIGTGYSNDESIYIYNCTAYNNKKYGFFFEHQSRFQTQSSKISYPATKADSFVVSNCIAYNNLYDFGGERANDVTYENCTSKEGSTCTSPMHFEKFSVKTHIVNFKSSKAFSDVDNSTYKVKQWSLTNGIAEGMGDGTFGVNTVISRATAIELLYRMNERQEDVFLYAISDNNKITTGFSDVDRKTRICKSGKVG